jgi:hypothetical protein
MAKRKTPKSNKIVDLKPKSEKLEELELQEIQGLVKEVDMVNLDVGRLESHKHNLLHKAAGLNDNIKIVQTKLEAKYGNVDIDIRDGKLTYKEDGQADS